MLAVHQYNLKDAPINDTCRSHTDGRFPHYQTDNHSSDMHIPLYPHTQKLPLFSQKPTLSSHASSTVILTLMHRCKSS